MPEQTARDKAISKIYSLRTLAEHPNTPVHEAEAARAAIKRLRDKHGIPEQATKAKPTGPRNPNFRPNDPGPYAQRAASDFQRWAEEQMWRKAQREQAERDYHERRRREERARYEAEAKQRAEARKAAQERYRQRMADKDANGVPLTEAEKEWARRDPLGFAASRDPRTQAQKQADMNAAWGQPRDVYDYIRTQQGPRKAQQTPKSKPNLKRCEKPEPFFDSGGNPRKRNERPIQCDRCSCTLQPGEGMVFEVAGRWYGRCAETKPGPRRKRW